MSPSDNGIIEQIDGVVHVEGQVYIVEMKWWNESLGVGDVAALMIWVLSGTQSRGIFIVCPDYSGTAIERVRKQRGRSPFVLCELEDVVHVRDTQASVPYWPRPIITAAIAKLPLCRKLQR